MLKRLNLALENVYIGEFVPESFCTFSTRQLKISLYVSKNSFNATAWGVVLVIMSTFKSPPKTMQSASEASMIFAILATF